MGLETNNWSKSTIYDIIKEKVESRIKMNIEEMEQLLNASPTKVAGIKFKPSIKPLEEFGGLIEDEFDSTLPNSMWLNLEAISSSYEYPDMYYSLAKNGDEYLLLKHQYQQYKGDFATFQDFASLDDVNEYIINDLRERANPKDLDKFLQYELGKDHSETLSQEDFAGLDDYEISR